MNGAKGATRRRRAVFFFFQAEDGIRDVAVTGVQTCALPISGLKFSCLSRALYASSKRCRTVWLQGTKWKTGRSAALTPGIMFGVYQIPLEGNPRQSPGVSWLPHTC